MKRFILILFLLPVCYAQVINNIDTNIYLTETDAKIEMNIYFSKINQIEFPIYNDIYDLNSERAVCIISSGIQKVIQCKPDVGSENIKISFNVKNIVRQSNGIMIFSYDMPISFNTKQVNVKLELPFGYALTDKVLVPISPPNTEVGTDGRKIFVRWEFKNKEPDDIIPLRVYFEKTGETNNIKYYGAIIAVSISIIIILIVLYLRLIKKKPELVLSVLNEAERMVVEILQSQPEEEVDQRKIVNLSGFSKAKVSRIIQSLEERGVIESIRYGRKNKIKLKKKFVKEETEQSEK
ncbi:MAG: hypothetical protein QW350_02245 [Candidatus Aenigmatarchaeota archaeon]